MTAQWPVMRDAQLNTAKTVPNTAMAVTIDVGDAANLHPHNKKPVGQRLASRRLPPSTASPWCIAGPTFASATFDASQAKVTFTSTGAGLDLAKPGGFELAGDDKKFLPASAAVAGSTHRRHVP